MPTGATESSSSEARRRRLLAQGSDRLKHITNNSGKDGVSRSLRFEGQEQPARQASLTPAASGLQPACDDREGAALRSKSWLAQESPPLSRKSSPDMASASQQTANQVGDEKNSASPLAPAHSASLAPVSSPAGNYASDDEPASVPNSPLVTRSSASSGTVLAAAPPPTMSSGSPQPLPLPPLPPSANGVPGTSPAPFRSNRRATQSSPAGAATKIQPAAAAQPMQGRRIRGAAAFQQALTASASARTLVAIACAAFFYAGGPEAAAVSWDQHFGQSMPGAALMQHVPPLAALLALQLLAMLLTFLLRNPVHQQPAAASLLGGLGAAAGAVSPQLHSALGVIWPLYQHLWQDVAVYIFTVALCTEAGAPRYHGHWRHLHGLVHHHASQIPPGWRVAAGRWTL